jgi:hypothetical protein
VHAALGAAVDRWGAAKRPMMRIDFDAYLADTSREIARGRTRARRGAERFSGSRPATSSSSRQHSLTGAHA